MVDKQDNSSIVEETVLKLSKKGFYPIPDNWSSSVVKKGDVTVILDHTVSDLKDKLYKVVDGFLKANPIINDETKIGIQLKNLTMPDEFIWDSVRGITSVNGEDRLTSLEKAVEEPIKPVTIKHTGLGYILITDEMAGIEDYFSFTLKAKRIIQRAINFVATDHDIHSCISSIFNFLIQQTDTGYTVIVKEGENDKFTHRDLLLVSHEVFVSNYRVGGKVVEIKYHSQSGHDKTLETGKIVEPLKPEYDESIKIDFIIDDALKLSELKKEVYRHSTKSNNDKFKENINLFPQSPRERITHLTTNGMIVYDIEFHFTNTVSITLVYLQA